jgi:hypothetical protein
MTLIIDGNGTMGASESFKPKVTLKDGVTGKLIDRTQYTSLSISFSVTNSVTGTTNASVSSGTVSTGTVSGVGPHQFTVNVSVTDSNSVAAKRYVPKTGSITVTVDSSKSGQTIKVHDGGSGSFGLRDLPLSRKPVHIGKMFASSAGLALSFSIANDSQKIASIKGTGTDTVIVFNEMSANEGVDGKFKGFGNDEEISFDIVASQAGNGSYHAAQAVSRTVKVKKPSKSVFFEERKADVRYEGVKTDALSRIQSKMGIGGEKALALFNSDSYDSDGDGVSNLLERAFGGDSLSNDSGDTLPKPIKKQSDGKEYLTFTRFNPTYQGDMGLEYIVEKSTDLRTWTTSGTEMVGLATDIGGGMERVVYRTTSATSSGSTQYIRVRVKAR